MSRALSHADFVRDNDNAGGAFCVAPASHKASLPVPEEYVRNPDLDPSMVGLEVKAGDVSRPRHPPPPRRQRPNHTLTLARQAVFFTENLRHGGFTNTTDVPRLTVHVGYGPGESRLPSCSLHTCARSPPHTYTHSQES